MRSALEWLALSALVLLAGSGVYDIAAGIRSSVWYLSWHEAQYGALPLSSVVFTYALGVFRGAVTLGCAAAGLAGIAKGRIPLWHLLPLGLCAYWYVGTVVHKAYKGSPAHDWVQLWIAAACLGVTAAYHVVLRMAPRDEA